MWDASSWSFSHCSEEINRGDQHSSLEARPKKCIYARAEESKALMYSPFTPYSCLRADRTWDCMRFCCCERYQVEDHLGSHQGQPPTACRPSKDQRMHSVERFDSFSCLRSDTLGYATHSGPALGRGFQPRHEQSDSNWSFGYATSPRPLRPESQPFSLIFGYGWEGIDFNLPHDSPLRCQSPCQEGLYRSLLCKAVSQVMNGNRDTCFFGALLDQIILIVQMTYRGNVVWEENLCQRATYLHYVILSIFMSGSSQLRLEFHGRHCTEWRTTRMAAEEPSEQSWAKIQRQPRRTRFQPRRRVGLGILKGSDTLAITRSRLVHNFNHIAPHRAI